MNEQEVTDSAFMGPWLANHIRESDGLATIMAYWCFSDVFEEQGVVKSPFYGGYGLIAERNIPKAAFRVFELLHTLGDRRLANASENALVTERADGSLVVALWNYAEPRENPGPRTFQLAVQNGKVKKYRMRMVAPGSGSALEAWKTMGSPAWPTLTQVNELIAASALAPAQSAPLNKPITLNPQTLAVLELTR
jgi:xylan 1,4-beta-xylosidase